MVRELRADGWAGRDCPVCLDSLVAPVLTSCAHLLCDTCLRQCFASSTEKRCPVCRVSLPDRRDIIPISSRHQCLPQLRRNRSRPTTRMPQALGPDPLPFLPMRICPRPSWRSCFVAWTQSSDTTAAAGAAGTGCSALAPMTMTRLSVRQRPPAARPQRRQPLAQVQPRPCPQAGHGHGQQQRQLPTRPSRDRGRSGCVCAGRRRRRLMPATTPAPAPQMQHPLLPTVALLALPGGPDGPRAESANARPRRPLLLRHRQRNPPSGPGGGGRPLECRPVIRCARQLTAGPRLLRRSAGSRGSVRVRLLPVIAVPAPCRRAELGGRGGRGAVQASTLMPSLGPRRRTRSKKQPPRPTRRRMTAALTIPTSRDKLLLLRLP